MADSLTSLAVFKNVICKEMIRSLHVYGSVEIEREFLFTRKSRYVEKEAKPLFSLEGLRRRPEISEGSLFGTWRCIFLYRYNHPVCRLPTLLCLSRNPKLEDIPNLAIDLKFISELQPKKLSKTIEHEQKQCSIVTSDQPKPRKLESKQNIVQDYEVDKPKPRKFALKQDLNCFPDSETESEESSNNKTSNSELEISKKKKNRAEPEHIARLSLEELSKYFGVTIVEASKNLNIGLTVLKKKCREFGIPRWPHRKIKSLDTLIHDLQGEVEKQDGKNEVVAMAVAKKKKRLEIEKRNILERPFMEMEIETRKIRQENFKKRHRASTAKKNQESLITSSSNEAF